MNIPQIMINKRRVKRRMKKKKAPEESCYHCGGAFKGSVEFENCLMCGREKGHNCDNCMHVPEDKKIQKTA